MRTVATKNTGLSSELLQQIVGVLLRHADPKKIILYGSRARGDYSAKSDIDIAIEPGDGKSFFRNVVDDEIRTLLKIEIISLDEAPEHLRRQMDEEGIVLYEKA